MVSKAIVFPSFWARPEKEGINNSDFYYDHPLPVDRDGWLPRCFESLRSLNDQNFEVIAVAGANTPSISAEVDSRVKEVTREYGHDLDTYVFSYEEFDQLKTIMEDEGHPEFQQTIGMTGYSDLRNLCLVAANIRDADVAVSIDDDVVFHEKDYLSRVDQGIKKIHDGKPIKALAGPYLHGDLDLELPEEEQAWTVPWHTTRSMNRAFNQYINDGPRYREPPFAIMGNIAVTQEFYCKIPLDPAMRRGEDSDWLFNALMLGERFVMDTEMPVHHRPPERPHPVWRSMREDIARFLYQRKKFREARQQIDDFPDLSFFEPFPGDFWTENLDDKIKEACQWLTMKYLSEDQPEDARETLKNYFLANDKFLPDDTSPVENYLSFQKRWVEMMDWVSGNRERIRDQLW